MPGTLLTARDVRGAYFTNSSLRSMPDNELRMWQLSRSGLFELLFQMPESENGIFVNLQAGMEAALQKLQQVYANLLPEETEFKVILAIYDGVRQLADPHTEPSGRWEEKIKSSEIFSDSTRKLVENLAAHIL